MLKLFSKILFLAIVMIGITSCVSKKNIAYIQNRDTEEVNSNNDYQLTFKPDDLLQIIVSADDIQSAQPFNLPIISTLRIGTSSFNSPPQMQSYLVDSQGFIQFPVIGAIKLGGLTRVEAIKKLTNELSPKYLKNPIININISNFKITVQGDVLRPGTFTVPNERLSIFDALGLAGDMNITGKRDNVLVIREENNKKVEYRLNLLSNTVFESPAYYLQQNDVVYVEPNNSKVQDSAYTRSSGLFISLASVIISLIAVIAR